MNKKSILYINDFETGGGAENVFQTCCKAFIQDYNIYHYTAYKEFKDTGKNIFSYIFSIKHYRAIKKIIEKNKIDIIHIHTFRWITPSVLFLARNLRNKQQYKSICVILTAHDYFLVCPNVAYGYYKQHEFKLFNENAIKHSFFFKQMDQHGHIFSWLKKLQWYFSFKFLHLENEINIVVTPSDFMRNVIQLNYPKLKTITVRNPLSRAVENTKKIRSDNTENPFKIIYLGRIASEKGVDKLILQLAALRQSLPELRLDIYGTGPYADYISELIKEHALEHIIQYHGYINYENVNELLPKYDAFIMSSIWYENAPLSIVEAAIQGLAVIVPDMGGMKEIAMLCGNAFFYNLADSKSLLAALLNGDATGKKASSSNNITEIAHLFSLGVFKTQLKSIYNT
jgi:glycosyltransferase involved in cell wall biosynthesis